MIIQISIVICLLYLVIGVIVDVIKGKRALKQREAAMRTERQEARGYAALVWCRDALRRQGCKIPLTFLDDCIALEDPTVEEMRRALVQTGEQLREHLADLPQYENATWYDDQPVRVALARLEGAK